MNIELLHECFCFDIKKLLILSFTVKDFNSWYCGNFFSFVLQLWINEMIDWLTDWLFYICHTRDRVYLNGHMFIFFDHLLPKFPTSMKIAVFLRIHLNVKNEFLFNLIFFILFHLKVITCNYIICVYFLFWFQATTLYCLVTEYAGGGELLAFIKMHPHTRLLEDKARPYVRQLVSAVHYLHERGVAHR